MTITIPPLHKVERRLPSGTPVNVDEAIRAQWDALNLADQVRGKRIALGVGSRGVAQIAAMARCLASLIRESGGDPFVIPAMGSHGGGTPAGQIEVLAGLNVTGATVGCPVIATMDTRVISHTDAGLPVYLDRFAAEADGFFIINRVKIHTDFHDRYESGLMKMLAIGLGNQDGATQIHNSGVQGLRHVLPAMARQIIQHSNLIAGIATVEDGYHRPVQLEIIPAAAIPTREPELLEVSRPLVARLPVDDIDVLVIDLMGKDISGAGMDTNVIGRWRIDGEPEPDALRIKAIVVLDLTEASHGNAAGVGLADFTVQRLLDKIDFPLFTRNIFTSNFLQRGRIPLVYATDQAAIEAAITNVYRAHLADHTGARVIRIRSTLDLATLWVSGNILREIEDSPDVIAAGPAEPLAFAAGNLV
ncbi:MAG: DUF2088 domain-containing protein [Anaerolineae bacterium]|nr:DUF2088 domain-containing protein [Anaerolineae bacterium]